MKVEIKILLIVLLMTACPCLFAESRNFVFPKGNLVVLAPPYINKDYYLLEFGFISEKQIKAWDYHYNAYVTGALFEDWKNQKDRLHAGGLGFKGGVMLPTQPWVPLLFTTTIGYAKTVLHRNPILGKDEQSAAKKDMILIEVGALYRVEKYFLRFAYQRSNVNYFNRHTILMMGVSY